MVTIVKRIARPTEKREVYQIQYMRIYRNDNTLKMKEASSCKPKEDRKVERAKSERERANARLTK